MNSLISNDIIKQKDEIMKLLNNIKLIPTNTALFKCEFDEFYDSKDKVGLILSLYKDNVDFNFISKYAIIEITDEYIKEDGDVGYYGFIDTKWNVFIKHYKIDKNFIVEYNNDIIKIIYKNNNKNLKKTFVCEHAK